MVIRFNIYLAVTAVYLTEAGPAVPRKLAILGPDVSLAQLSLQEDYLKTQSQVLQTSIQISKIAQTITKEAFQTSDEAKLVLILTTRMVLEAAESMKNTGDLNTKQCIKKLGIKDDLSLMKTRMQQQIFSCTHTLSYQAMQLEKKMTSLINSVRAHVIQAMDSMWLCEPEEAKVGEEWKRVIDEACLTAMKKEGDEITFDLPEKANYILDEARDIFGTSESSLKMCMVKSKSDLSERATFLLQQIRNCSFIINTDYFHKNY